MNKLIQSGNPSEVAGSLLLMWNCCSWDLWLPFRGLDLIVQSCSLSLKLPGCLIFHMWTNGILTDTLDLHVLIYLLIRVGATTIQTSSSGLKPGRQLVFLV